MTSTGTHSLHKSLLHKAEWLAENAYIPPGMHRLLTVTGLMAGLWGGRQIMDIITAKNSEDGSELRLEQVPEIMRPIHGIMRYNAYSDAPSDRWRGVLDAIAPVVVGSLGAFAGRQHYFYGGFGKGKHHALSNNLRQQAAQKMSIEAADGMMSLHQSNATAKFAAASLDIGSAAGTHLTGALFPLNNGSVATSFQLGNLSKNNFPLPRFLREPLNKMMGNNSTGSRHLFRVIRDWVKWAEANIVHHPHIDWKNEKEIMQRAHDALQLFPDITPAGRKAFQKEMHDLLDKLSRHASELQKQGKTVADIERAIYTEAREGFSGQALEEMFVRSGIDITKAKIGINGPFTTISRLLGSGGKEQETLASLYKHWREDLKIDTSHLSTKPNGNTLGNWVSAGSIASSLGVAGWATHHDWQVKRERKHHREPEDNNKPMHERPRHEQAALAHRDAKQGNNIVDWINAKPLDAMQWLSRVLIVPPSMHRFMSAAYLSAGLWGGMQIADTLTGRKLSLIRAKSAAESLLTKEQSWTILKPLHGLLSYIPARATSQDRWRQVAHTMLPVAVGAFGTYTGGQLFFKSREEKLAHPEYLDEYTDKISFDQSKPFGVLTALTSIFNTGSGIHILPFFNYSANLHDRFLLANGQQIAFPLIGQWWSGNRSTLPWGVAKTLKYTVNYLTQNPDEYPRQLPELVHAVVAKLYPDLNEAEINVKEEAIIDKIYAVRDPFIVEGKIAPLKKEELKEALSSILTKSGLEKTLQSVGLDPAKADIANNGVSGAIANLLGQKQHIEALKTSYQQKAMQRLSGARPVSQDKQNDLKSQDTRDFRERIAQNRMESSDVIALSL